MKNKYLKGIITFLVITSFGLVGFTQSTSISVLLPPYPGDATKYLNGNQQWTVPAGGGGGGSANWTASGTTNSTLAGVASANGMVATNSMTLAGTSLTNWPFVMRYKTGSPWTNTFPYITGMSTNFNLVFGADPNSLTLGSTLDWWGDEPNANYIIRIANDGRPQNTVIVASDINAVDTDYTFPFFVGVDSIVSMNATNNTEIDSIQGEAYYTMPAPNQISYLNGVAGFVQNNNTGFIDSMNGFICWGNFSESGTARESAGLRIWDMNGYATNNYAIVVEDQTVGANNYAIKTGNGKVSFGDVTTGIKGFGSTAVTTVTTSATGATNTLTMNVLLYVTAATGAALTDNAGTTEFSGVTIAAFTPVRLQPGGKFTGTAITYATGTASHAW